MIQNEASITNSVGQVQKSYLKEKGAMIDVLVSFVQKYGKRRGVSGESKGR